MYSNDDGYIYFTDINEVKELYDEDGSVVPWDIGGHKCWKHYNIGKMGMSYPPEEYRRCLTSDFRIRKEFRKGDPVCAYGVNGVVDYVDNDILYPVMVEFSDEHGEFFNFDGKAYDWHKTPSLSHGHNSTVDNQKYPVERVETKKAMSQADEVAECIPHWQENLRLAIKGEKINVSTRSCYLCVKYLGKSKGDCHQCPIYKDTNAICCSATPYRKSISGKPEHVLEMLNFLIDLERRLRKAGK